jgi:hypothetical protein
MQPLFKNPAKKFRRFHLRAFLAWGFVVASLVVNSGAVWAATLTSASVSLSDPRPSATSVNYDFQGSSVTTSAIRCIKVIFATTAQGTTKPTNMVTASGITIDAATDYIPTPASWSRGGSDPDGTVTFTNATGETPASASARNWILAGFTNSSVADTSFYYRFSTYNNTDCSTSPVDSVTVAFILTNGQSLTLSVDATLSFTVNAVSSGQTCNGATSTQSSTSTTIPFGSVTVAANSIVCQDLQVASNSNNGYTVYIRYTGQPTSGSDTIADHTGSNASPTVFSAAGTEAYGYTTDDATLQALAVDRFISNKWAANTTSNSEVAYSATGVTSQTTRVGHQIGISSTTQPGVYSTTVVYTATPVY